MREHTGNTSGASDGNILCEGAAGVRRRLARERRGGLGSIFTHLNKG